MYLLSLSVSMAQTSIIKAIIIDSAHQNALGNVTITVQETDKQKFVRYAMSNENGFFKVKGLEPKQYQLIISCIGYKTITVNLPPLTPTTIDLGKIVLVALPHPLKEINIVAKQQLIEQDIDKLIYHVDQDPEKEILSLLEMLRKIPLLSIDAEDNVLLNGNSSYQLLINGIRSSLFSNNASDFFKSMRAGMVKSIEVITNPSSKYEAAGASGIINIVTHKKNISGYNGSANISTEYPFAYNLSSYAMIKSGRIGINTQVAANTQNNPVNIYTLFREDMYQKSKLAQTGESKSNNHFQYVNGDVSYDLNDLNVFTINYNLNESNGTFKFNQQTALLNAENKLTSAYHRSNASATAGNGFDIGLNYQKSFKRSNRQLLMVSGKLSNSTNTSNSNYKLMPLLYYNNQASNTNYTDATREQSIQIDYIQPLKHHTFELGITSTFRSNGSNYAYYNLDPLSALFVPDASLSNNFNYQQNIHAFYTTFNWKKRNWALRTGIRIEQTTDDADYKSSLAIVSRRYVNFIPNITLLRKLKNANTLRLSYMQRLERPGLYYLNPYINFTDPKNITYGNPQLKPAIAHTFNFSYNILIKESFLCVGLVHTFTNNSMQQYTILIDSVSHTTFGNIGGYRNSSLSISGNTRLFKEINLNINASARYIKYTTTINNILQNRKGLAYNLFGSANYRTKTWGFNADLSYSSANVSTQGKTAGFVKNSISVNKQLLKDKKATVSLSVNNPFQNKRHSFTEANDPAFHMVQESWIIFRRFIMSCSYRFGKIRK